MSKFEDFEAYYKKLATEAGVSEEDQAVMVKVLKNDKIREGFVMRPDYSRDLDSVRDKTAKEIEKTAGEKAQAYYQNWVNTEVQPKLDEANKAKDELMKYKAAYGDLTGTGDPVPTNGNGNYLTKEDFDKAKAELAATNQSMALNLLKQGVPIALKHYQDFNEVLNLEELEKFGNEHGYTNAPAAYDAYVKPRREEKQNAEWEAKLKKAKEEGIKEGQSRLTRTAHEREYSTPFLRPKPETPEDPRQAFFEGLEEDTNQ